VGITGQEVSVHEAFHNGRVLVAALFSLSLASQASATSIGAGLHYLRAIGDFDDEDNIDENDFGVLGSLQFNHCHAQG
jgi:hypothetical protein